MIAVFVRTRQMFEYLNPHPSQEFKYIRDKRQILGASYTGVISIGDPWYIPELSEAYELLRQRQPELFK